MNIKLDENMLNDENIACLLILWINTPIGIVRFNRLSMIKHLCIFI